MKYLVIVESPAKTKLIKKYLEATSSSDSFLVEACFGHIRDLCKENMGIDLETLRMTFVIDSTKKSIVQKLKKMSNNVDMVLLATDNDREGESISWNLKETLNLKKTKYKRMIFNEITQEAITNAFHTLKLIDMDLVNAQQARRVIDRVVGFKLSPLLWKNFKLETWGGAGLSVGRVQTAALKYIVDREKDIEKHNQHSYYTVKGTTSIIDTSELKLYNIKQNELTRFTDINEARNFLFTLKGPFIIVKSKVHDNNTSPQPPFITSTLQQEAHTQLGFSVKMTMMTAQKLYERGLITYMRTDSYNISDQAQHDIKQLVSKKYGEAQYVERNYASKKKVKNGQEAHEAIRPTKFHQETINGEANQVKLYELIWKRAIASQMASATYLTLDFSVKDDSWSANYDKELRGRISILKEPGFKVVWGEKSGDIESILKLAEKISEKAYKLQITDLTAKHTWSSAPTRFNEPLLIKVLERDGIGRPSTYAGILEKLYSKNYVMVQNAIGITHDNIDLVWKPSKRIKETYYQTTTNSETNRLVPSDIGKRILQYVDAHFSDVSNVEYTSRMEEHLDDIANGTDSWEHVVKSFWKDLETSIQKASKLIPASKEKEVLSTTHTEFVINKKTYIVRMGKYGPLIETKGEKAYIGLRPYLKLTKKSYTDIVEDDIALLLSMPKAISINVHLKYGRYGFYIDANGENVMLPAKWINKEIGGWANIDKLNSKHVPVLIQMKKDYLAQKLLKNTTKNK